MTALETVKNWLRTYTGFDILAEFQVDYTDGAVPNNGGIFPAGLVETVRRRDIMGTVTVTNQYNFGIYCVFSKPPGDSVEASVNADWVMEFQEWVQAQSALGLAPTFGDRPEEEKITAQNGVLYEAGDEGTATYMVQLAVQFRKRYER